MKFYYKPAFLKAHEKLSRSEQELVLKTDIQIKDYLKTSQAPFGLRIKQLRKEIFEARVSDRLRIVWRREPDGITFALLGNHEEVRRFLKSF